MQSRAQAMWEGDLTTGKGRVSSRTSGVLRDAGLTWKARTESAGGTTTTPEELLAASHASCFAMALSNGLAKSGKPAQKLDVSATVTFGPKQGGGFSVQESSLEVRGTVAGIDAAAFQQAAEAAKEGCPISQALKNNVKLSVRAELEGTK
ncbi:MAG TPA: OsmC family peroxiredoxin [Myxococcales bacterium]|nr:OsmC family peroxiredoxin [Myxococcales bacterium]